MEVKRTEHKFVLNCHEAVQARKNIGSVVPRDPYCTAPEGYEIRSLYFDTVTDRACAEKEDGLRIHEKIRVRIYGTDDRTIKLESKRKVGEYQTKYSMLIDRETLDELVKCNYGALLKIDNPKAFYFYKKLSEGMMPKAIIVYKRISYCVPTNNTRITFDYDIRSTESSFDLFQDPLLAHPIFPADKVIMEVKYNNFLFGYIKDVLSTVKKSPSSYSKYFSGRLFYRYMV